MARGGGARLTATRSPTDGETPEVGSSLLVRRPRARRCLFGSVSTTNVNKWLSKCMKEMEEKQVAEGRYIDWDAGVLHTGDDDFVLETAEASQVPSFYHDRLYTAEERRKRLGPPDDIPIPSQEDNLVNDIEGAQKHENVSDNTRSHYRAARAEVRGSSFQPMTMPRLVKRRPARHASDGAVMESPSHVPSDSVGKKIRQKRLHNFLRTSHKTRNKSGKSESSGSSKPGSERSLSPPNKAGPSSAKIPPTGQKRALGRAEKDDIPSKRAARVLKK